MSKARLFIVIAGIGVVGISCANNRFSRSAEKMPRNTLPASPSPMANSPAVGMTPATHSDDPQIVASKSPTPTPTKIGGIDSEDSSKNPVSVAMTASFSTGSDVQNNDCVAVSANGGPYASLGCSRRGSNSTQSISILVYPPPRCNKLTLKLSSNEFSYTTDSDPGIFARRFHPESVTPSSIVGWLNDDDGEDFNDFHMIISTSGAGLFNVSGAAGGCQ